MQSSLKDERQRSENWDQIGALHLIPPNSQTHNVYTYISTYMPEADFVSVLHKHSVATRPCTY